MGLSVSYVFYSKISLCHKRHEQTDLKCSSKRRPTKYVCAITTMLIFDFKYFLLNDFTLHTSLNASVSFHVQCRRHMLGIRWVEFVSVDTAEWMNQVSRHATVVIRDLHLALFENVRLRRLPP